jgi:hypothetical protein
LKTIAINTWEEFQNIVASDQYRSWAFRGQGDANWELESTLSRYLKTFGVHPTVWAKQERRIFRIFKRKVNHFLPHLPKDEDAFEWLSIMKHHGAPTRLLDFTWSPYVAAFFALECATSKAAIWAIFPIGLKKNQKLPQLVNEKIDHDKISVLRDKNYYKYFINNNYTFVTHGEPYRMNRRLIAQSGTFIVPSRIDKNIVEIIGEDESVSEMVVKFELNTKNMRHETLRRLYNMNITFALFSVTH